MLDHRFPPSLRAQLRRGVVAFTLALQVIPFTAQAADTLEEYAQQCDAAIGVTVPDFDCAAGTQVPGDLSGRTIQVLTENADSVVVAQCRKLGSGPELFDDVTVTQRSKADGQTCRYRAGGGLDGHMKAPSRGIDESWLFASDQYAAIWERPSVPFVARHGMTSDEYQAEFNRYVSQGYRLTVVDGYDIDGTARYAATWELRPSAPWVARHGMSSFAYQQAFNELVGQGFRLVWVNGYTVGGVDQYAAIWERSGGPEWVARHGMTSAQYQTEFDNLTRAGFRLKVVSGYAVGFEPRYAAIWERSDGTPFIARHGMTAAEYQNAFNQHVGQGFRLVLVSGYRVGFATLYAAIWDRSPSQGWVARHGMSSAEYQAEFNRYVGQGFKLSIVSGY